MEPKIIPTYSGLARFTGAGHMRGTGPFIVAMVTCGYLFRGILKPQDYSAVSSEYLYYCTTAHISYWAKIAVLEKILFCIKNRYNPLITFISHSLPHFIIYTIHT